ncbi:hypothetical protein GCM10010522_35300 [Kribbella solani]|uniref:Uncharacterized protein n=1 Tax=Kribbella solani TaxID=236067 RepID=A0A841DVP4_9ACTN|nr:hypothetical protein [Kribbella solani]MBB5980337.1 hypothetical protein [Kribbella solani]
MATVVRSKAGLNRSCTRVRRPLDCCQLTDSRIRRRSAHVTIASSRNCPKINLGIKSPYFVVSRTSTITTSGPSPHKNPVNVTNLPRCAAGELSPTSASAVGTSAPIASPTTITPMKSIGIPDANTNHSRPKA